MLLYFRYLGKAVCYIPDNCPLALYSSPLRGMDPHSPGLFSESLLRMLHYRCPTPPRISILRQLKNLSQKLDMVYLKKGKSFFFKLMSIDRTRKNKCTHLDTVACYRWTILQRPRNSPFLRRKGRCRTYSATGSPRRR